MRKITVLLLAFLFVSFFNLVLAQNTKFGITGGVSISSYKGKEGGITLNSDSKVGLTVGVLAEVPLGEKLAFQPGLNFTQKGGKLKITDANYEATTTLNYLEVPLNVLFKAEAGQGKFFIGLGPVLGFGLSGKNKYDDDGDTGTEDIKFGNDENNDDLKPFELAGNVLAGYQLSNGLFISLNYNLGLSNLLPGGDSDNTYKNNYFGIRLGYMFGGK